MPNIQWGKIFKENKITDDLLKKYLQYKWRNIRNEKTNGWQDPSDFVKWYAEKEQNGCYYCEIPQGKVKDAYGKLFKKGKGERGRLLEIDRKDPTNTIYDKNNCALACYPCNNAKSNIFNDVEFTAIGNAIKNVWSRKKT